MKTSLKNRKQKRNKKVGKVSRLIAMLCLLAVSINTLTVHATEHSLEVQTKTRIQSYEISLDNIFSMDIFEVNFIDIAPTYEEQIDILDSLSEEELFYFAECVEIEAEGEGFDGKIAVASVLTNRVNSSNFPNSYQEVVSQKVNGVYQFSSYSSSVWNEKPITEETYEAIRTVLVYGSTVEDATFFANLNTVKTGWFYKAKEDGTLVLVAEIGRHSFFRTTN